MTDLSHRLEEVRPHLDRTLTEEQLDAVIVRARRRQRRRVRSRVAAVAVIVLLTAGVGVQRATRPAPHAMVFADGSTAELLDPQSDLHTTEPEPGRTLVKLARGGARFEVTHNPKRVFRVEAGDVAVEVLGTRFSVERLAEQVRVQVERGRVRVLSGGERRVLGAGESAEFPLESAAPPSTPVDAGQTVGQAAPSVDFEVPAADEVEVPRSTSPAPRHQPASHAAPPVRSWRSSAEDGNFEQAYVELKSSGGVSAVRDVPQELLLASDVARLSNHASDAVPLLERLLRDHPADPRAQLAAFTLGRVLLEELGRPHEAADAFARARRLNPTGPLASDSLAREVEAWSRAGDRSRARELAEQYVESFPHGAQLSMVRRFGGLE